MSLQCIEKSPKDHINRCFVSDLSKHKKNQQILKTVLENELSSLDAKSPAERANFLIERISHIGKKLCVNGFFTDAYQVPRIDENSIVSFNAFVVWEGEQIPLTFFIYVWPSKELAQRYYSDSWNSYYGSVIHSHPISCAFVVLDGVLIQRNFALLDSENRTVRLTTEDTFQKFDAAIDSLATSFIHQLYGKGTGSLPTITLHAYGLPTEKEVMESFKTTFSLHSFSEISLQVHSNNEEPSGCGPLM